MKILLVEDSPFVRGIVRTVLGKRGISVITADSLKEGIDKLSEKPDLVILDINLPDGNGLELLKHFEPSKVIVFSGEREYILEALEMGVMDFVPKPKHPGDIARIIKLIDGVLLTHREPLKSTPKVKKTSQFAPDIVLVGASSGSPGAIIRIFSSHEVKLPVIICLHLQEGFAESFARRVGADMVYPGRTRIKTRKYLLYPSTDYAFVSMGIIESVDTKSPYKPSVDVLFSSSVRFYKDKVLGIILSGIGKDGQRGSADIKSAGGRIIAQSRESAPVWGMPLAVFGIADEYMKDEEISEYLKTLGVFIS